MRDARQELKTAARSLFIHPAGGGRREARRGSDTSSVCFGGAQAHADDAKYGTRALQDCAKRPSRR